MAQEGLVYNKKMSSVGPGIPTEPDFIFEPGSMDLAMKLHYLRSIYYFESQAFEGLATLAIKEPMFTWLNEFPTTSGRFRRTESGRPHMKCNDCGVRFLEAKCDKTLEEWLGMKDATLEKLLVHNHFIGPDLGFSPVVYLQLTKFKCGGMAVGLSWAHVLGDPYSAARFMKLLGRAVAGHEPGQPIKAPTKSTVPDGPPKVVEDPLSVKRVGPYGDIWAHETKCKMEAFSFNVTPLQLSNIQSKLSPNGAAFAPFEALSAVIWQSIARIRGKDCEPKVVTICTKGEQNKVDGALSNTQIVSMVKASFPIVEANTSKLAALVKNEALDERGKIEQVMERENGLPDFIIYGANLTFVNLEGAEFYEFEYRACKPVSVSYRIDGVGEGGAFLVLPGPRDGGNGRYVMAILPENEAIELKSALEKEGLMV